MSAVYTIPVMPNVVNIWRNGAAYTDPPDVVTVGNLALGRRVAGSKLQDGTTNPSDGGMWLLVPKDTDIRDSKALTGEDMVEVPGGTGRLYTVKWVDDIGKGFANEHRFGVLMGLPPWGVPFPGPPLPPPPPVISLPYANAFPYPSSVDAISFVPTGSDVIITVWVFSPTGATPILTSTSAVFGVPLSFTPAVTSTLGIVGKIYTWIYSPSGAVETLSINVNDALSAFAWEVDDLLGGLYDQVNQLTVIGGLSGTVTTGIAGPTSDSAFGPILVGPGFGAPTISPPGWVPAGELPAVALPDRDGVIWGFDMYFQGSLSPPGTVSLTQTYGAVSDFSCIVTSIQY